MKVVYIVIQLLYGILIIEVSDSYMVSYNYYEEETIPKGFLVIDYSSDSYYRAKHETDKIVKLDNLRSAVKEEVLFSEKVKDTLFLEKFKCQVIKEHTRLEKPKSQTKITQGDILMLRELKLEDKNYAYLPCIGSSFQETNLFNFATYFITDNDSALSHRVIEIEERQGFSEIATEMINLIK